MLLRQARDREVELVPYKTAMHPHFPRCASLQVVVRTVQPKISSLPRITRIASPFGSRAHRVSYQFSSSAAHLQTTMKDPIAPRYTNVAPAEPWRCHFEFDKETPAVYTFFDKTTSTWSYILADMKKAEAVVIDPVLEYDPASGQVSTSAADALLSFTRNKGLAITAIVSVKSLSVLCCP